MHIISKKRLREFWSKEKRSEIALDAWFRKLRGSSPTNLVEMKDTFASADLVGICVVFNVGGNKYRVITRISFRWQKVFIRHVLTHKEYDKGKWKADCDC